MRKPLIVALVYFAMVSYAMAVETTFSPRLTMRGEYTDNVDRTHDDPQDDFITTVSPGATLGLRGNTAEMTLSYDPAYVMYRDNDQDDGWRHFGTLNGFWSLSRRTRLNIANALTISEDPADDVADSTLARGRNRYTRYSGTLGITQQFGREDSFGGGYTYSSLTNEEEYVEDSQEHGPYADFMWWFIENLYGLQLHTDYTIADFKRRDGIETSDDFTSWYGQLRLRRRFTRNFDMFLEYGHTVTNYDGMTEDYTVYNPAVGLNYVAGEETNISMALGYFIRDREKGADDSGTIVSGDLTTAWSYPRGAVSLTATSGCRTDTFDTENLGFNYYASVGVRADYGFTRNFRGDVFGDYRYDKYFDVDPEREDNTYGTGCGLSYQVLAWMSLRLEYRYSTVSSNVEEEEYDENRVFMSVTLAPVSPYRLN
jgi:opacity protein-like surface antigen